MRAFLLLLFTCCIISSHAANPGLNEQPSAVKKNPELPLLFRKNVGQLNDNILFYGTSPGWQANIVFTKPALSFNFNRPHAEEGNAPGDKKEWTETMVWNLSFVGMNKDATVTSEGETNSHTNYLLGKDISKHRSNVPDCKVINYNNIYPGINLKFYGGSKALEYDYILQPGTEVSTIKMACNGIKKLHINNRGQLEINTLWGTLIEELPESYQVINGEKKLVNVFYQLYNDSVFGFKCSGQYNKAYELIIDPVNLAWATFIGDTSGTFGIGGQGYCHDIAVDASGNVYGTGYHEAKFPVTPGVYQTTYKGTGQQGVDAFVYKMDPAGNIVWATYVGGTGSDCGYGIALDPAGNVYVAGLTTPYTNYSTSTTYANDFPVTAGVIQPNQPGGYNDAFVFKLNASGSALLYSTYLGGTGTEGYLLYSGSMVDIAVDAAGQAFVTGATSSADFPVAGGLGNPYAGGSALLGDAFVSKLNASATAMIYSTFIGGSGEDGASAIALNSAGEVYIAGATNSGNFPVTAGAFQNSFHGSGTLWGGVASGDAFITHLNAAGNALISSTYFGGSGGEDVGEITINSGGDVFFTGSTSSGDMPVIAGPYTSFTGQIDAYVARLKADGSALIYSSYLGGAHWNSSFYPNSAAAAGMGITINSADEAFVAGYSLATDFPTTLCAYQHDPKPQSLNSADWFLSKFNASGTKLLYSTLIGGSSDDYYFPKPRLTTPCLDEVYVGGTTHSNDFPGASARGRNNFGDVPTLVKFKPTITPGFTFSAVCDNITFTDASKGSCVWSEDPWAASSWLWDFGDGTTSTLQNPHHQFLADGTYNVKLVVRCPMDSITIPVTIKKPVITAINSTNASCGANNGSVTATATGGTGSLTFSWNNGTSGQTVSGLSANTYTLTVTDGNSCSKTATVNVTNSNGPAVTANVSTAILCKGGNGSATAVITGGNSPYTYSWNTGTSSTSNSTSQAAGNFSVGTYTVTVTDGNSCSATASVTFTEPPAIIIDPLTSVNASCGAGNGSATASANGGTGTLTYNWNNGSTGTTATGLAANNYTVTIKDGNSCSQTATVTVNKSNGPAVAASISTAIKCKGGTGVVDLTATGGSSPYTFSWSNGTSAVSNSGVQQTNNLTAGDYTVNVTDGNGCSGSTTITITQPGAIIISSVTPTNAFCGSSNGSATASATGGTGSLIYNWNNGASGQTVTALAIGTYILTVTDANGCTQTATTLINNNNGPSTTMGTPTSVTCHGGNNGSATVTITGGSSPFTFNWSNGSTDATASGLVAGSYTATVTDAQGCSGVSTVLISEPTAIALADDHGDATCGIANGSINILSSGGTGPYTYNWMSGASTQTISGLSGGTYSVTVTDSKGCTNSTNVSISQGAAVTIAAQHTDATCTGNNGSAAIIPSGGSGSFTYSWTGGLTTSSVSNLAAGSYTGTVTDSKGCGNSSVFIIAQPGAGVLSVSNTGVSCNGGNDASATASVAGGSSPFTFLWSNGNTNTTITNLSSGIYTVSVTDSKSCSSSSTVSITEPAVMLLNTSASSTICTGTNATLTSTASGGTSGYTYAWMPGNISGASVTVNPASATTYTVSVTDLKNCTKTNTVTISLHPALAVDVSSPQHFCEGGSTTLNASANGGNGIYTYTWTPGGNTTSSINVSPTTTTTYTVTINDGCGTPAAVNNVTVTVDALPVVKFTADTLQGCAPACVKFSDLSSITGGSTITSWKWNFGGPSFSSQQSPEHCFDQPGKYNVTLTAASDKGCTQQVTINQMINVFDYPKADFSFQSTTGSSVDPVFNFTDLSTGSPTKWRWNFNDVNNNASSTIQNPSHSFSDTGTFCVNLTITNAMGCKDTTTHCLGVIPDWTFYVPNAFTPNGDGKNDDFGGYGTAITGYELWIFDRWGNQVFYSDSMYKRWNGKVLNGSSNDIAQQDAYVWMISFIDSSVKKHKYTGHVSLIK